MTLPKSIGYGNGAATRIAAKNVTRKGAGRHVISDMKHWGTPQKYADAVMTTFGGKLDLDPCSSAHSLVEAATRYLPQQIDGLKAAWNFRTIFVNPPYGNDKENGTTIKHWFERCAHANEVYGSEVLALVPVAVNTMHWKKYVFTKARAVCFLYDTRLRFLENGRDVGKGAPMACAMVYWGENLRRFYDVFIEHGAVVDISNLIGEKIGPNRREPSLPKNRSANEVAQILNEGRRGTVERLKKLAAALHVDFDDLT